LCSEDWADSDVVGSRRARGFELRDVVRRYADPERRFARGARGVDGQVFLADVNSSSTGKRGNVRSIVDNDANAEARRGFDRATRNLEILRRREIFRANLHQADAS
jgi:hypothetical protein